MKIRIENNPKDVVHIDKEFESPTHSDAFTLLRKLKYRIGLMLGIPEKELKNIRITNTNEDA
jgi:hypothetical protein